VSLALAAVMVVGAGAAETPKGSAAATGTLSVTTDPDNADVYVDGRLAGQTPTSIAALSAGEHRVRIVKNGYLENARLVTLAAGEPTRLNVKLTKTTGVSNETAGQVTSTGGGGGSKKWLWIGLAGAGAAAVVVAAMPHNKAPVPGTITVSPTATGMAGITSFTFTSTGASDPDGDSLTKTWTSSDGGSGTGDTFTRTFASAGSFNVTLKVSDGKLDASTPAVAVTVAASMTANWTGGVEPGFTNSLFSVNLTQSGTNLTGTLVFSGNSAGSIGVTGTLGGTTYPTSVNFTTPAYSIGGGVMVTDSFSGNTDGNGATMTGTVTTRLSPPFVFPTGSNTATGTSTLRR
jgi:hypothetical protein